MKSLTTLTNYATSLSQNTSTANAALFQQMINDAHRYLLQQYFFNERSASISTVGDQQGYTLPYNYSKLKTGTLTIGNLRWTPTEILTREEWDALNVFPNYSDIPNNFFIYDNKFNLWPIPSTGSTSATYSGLTGTLVSGDSIVISTVTGKILTFTSSIIQIAIESGLTLPTGAFTTGNGATGTVSSTTVTAGNTITFNYKIRVPDLSIVDYTAGTAAVTNGSKAVVGTTTAWLAQYLASAGSVKNLNLWIKFNPPLGDGNWYQIDTVNSATSLTLLNNYDGETTAGISYTIGQMPLLLEDFHDLPVYRALMIYFSSINKIPTAAKEFSDLYQAGILQLDEYSGSKALQVDLSMQAQVLNPNIFPQSIG